MKKANSQDRWDHDRRATLEVLQGTRPIWRGDGKDWLGHTKGAADMDAMLVNGTTVAAVMEETTRKRNTSFHRHKNTLQTEHGLRVARKGNVYRFDREAIEAALGLAVSPKAAGPKAASTVASEAAKLGSSYFSPDPAIDERPRVLQEIARRQGQPRFRENLISAYGGKCAVSGCWEANALEAAHIDRYLGKDSHHVQNGLLLRADIHTLFDQDLIRICPDDFTVEVAEEVEDPAYRQFHGKRISLPEEDEFWPSKEALTRRFRQA